MGRPEFKHGSFIIKDYSGRKLQLSERTWTHITDERSRDYFERLFDKIVETIKDPSQVRKSTKENNVVIYEKDFDDFYITNTVLGRAYVNVVANWNTNRIAQKLINNIEFSAAEALAELTFWQTIHGDNEWFLIWQSYNGGFSYFNKYSKSYLSSYQYANKINEKVIFFKKIFLFKK